MLGLGATQNCHASCGDWLEMDAQHAESAQSFENESIPLPLPCDCRGPLCEQQDPRPLPLPSRDFEWEQHRSLATLRACIEADTEVDSWKAIWCRTAERAGYPRLIDRPPRTA